MSKSHLCPPGRVCETCRDKQDQTELILALIETGIKGPYGRERLNEGNLKQIAGDCLRRLGIGLQ